jgi:tetraacyldisaccharide 4'-kinase
MRAPKFWEHDGLAARLLSPLSALWRFGLDYRATGVESFRAGVPVICVGNVVAGGAGKTPVVLALAQRLASAGLAPHILTRGYGGSETGPVRVSPAHHTAAQVGDEALLLAAAAPCWVAQWRPKGAVAATKGGADVIVMDDGYQNHTLIKDMSLLVVDGVYGFGNGRLMPAGPCREPPDRAIARADAVIVIGEDRHGIARMAKCPVLRARLVPTADSAPLKGRKVVAFAGIGRPEKFFTMLVDVVGAQVMVEEPFADHHPFTVQEIQDLLDEAQAQDAVLVTTAKDWVRIPPDLQDRVRVVSVTLDWQDAGQLDRLLAPFLGNDHAGDGTPPL